MVDLFLVVLSRGACQRGIVFGCVSPMICVIHVSSVASHPSVHQERTVFDCTIFFSARVCIQASTLWIIQRLTCCHVRKLCFLSFRLTALIVTSLCSWLSDSNSLIRLTNDRD